MPTILSHPAVPLALAPWLRRCPRSLIAFAAITTMLPDVDVAAFRLDIPYAHALGHRGFTHSLLFAVLVAAFLAFAYARARRDVSFGRAFALLFAAVASHGVLDALTNGGLGVGFFIPFTNERFFFPVHPIRVSPIGRTTAAVLKSELLWIWAPAAVIAAAGVALTIAVRRRTA